MDFEKQIRQKLYQEEFKENNGRVIRTINILQGHYINLHSLKEALSEYMNIAEFDESIVYLHKSCYVEIRAKWSKKVVIDINEYSYKELEVCFTQKGIKLLRGFITDEAVEV